MGAANTSTVTLAGSLTMPLVSATVYANPSEPVKFAEGVYCTIPLAETTILALADTVVIATLVVSKLASTAPSLAVTFNCVVLLTAT